MFRLASTALFFLLVVFVVLPSTTLGFAYAPNFITKIVQDQTGIQPIGLLEINDEDETTKVEVTAAGGGDDDGGDDDDSTTVSSNVGSSFVTTRFPPEPNGYLHLGHAKAVCFNFAVARMFGGKCNMRMDDTNPSKEDEEYVESILRDVLWIQRGLYKEGTVPWDGDVKKTSDYFDIIYDAAVALIQSGDAYVDSLSAEEMREYRGSLTEPGKDSPYRTRSVEENLELFQGVSIQYFSPVGRCSWKRAMTDVFWYETNRICLLFTFPLFEKNKHVKDERWKIQRRSTYFAGQN